MSPSASAKPKVRMYPNVRIAATDLQFWQTSLMPNINKVLQSFYKRNKESVEISLESIGESPQNTKPTVLVVCTSVHKVRAILRRSLSYDQSKYGLKVCKGRIIRSRKKRPLPHRSMMNAKGENDRPQPANAFYQAQPLNGASIGAYVREKHHPAVSFGGIILVDGEPFGMTVHHMLDPSDGETSDEDDPTGTLPMRSIAAGETQVGMSSDGGEEADGEFAYDLSGTESNADVEYASSETSAESDDISEEYGDIPGISEDHDFDIFVTQPAIDDVLADFFPSPDDKDDEHLSSHKFGSIHASSGLRRRIDSTHNLHEIDWSLFRIMPARLVHPPHNIIQGANSAALAPTQVLPSSELGDLRVRCMARTSGFQTGRILPGLVSMKMRGRQTPSHSFQVAGGLGIPGDSGAWLVDDKSGKACGHVLAYSQTKKVAYICPMDIMLADIAETLGVDRVTLPGGEMLGPAAAGNEVRDEVAILDMTPTFHPTVKCKDEAMMTSLVSCDGRRPAVDSTSQSKTANVSTGMSSMVGPCRVALQS